MQSIEAIGLQTPISVRWIEEHDDYIPVLVAGLHRLEACRRLGWACVPACNLDDEIAARLWEISENLDRAELSALEKADHITEWMRLHEIKRKGEVSRQLDANPKGGRPEGGVRAASRALGIPEVEARRANKIALIMPDAREAIANAGITTQKDLLDIAAAPPAEQAARVAEITAERERKARIAAAHRQADSLVKMAAKERDNLKRSALVSIAEQAPEQDDAATWLLNTLHPTLVEELIDVLGSSGHTRLARAIRHQQAESKTPQRRLFH